MTPPPNTTRMTGSTYLQNRARRKPWGLGVVVLLHLLVFWAIQAGLTRDITRQIPQVVQAVLLQETPPPPPPQKKIEPPPKPQPPAPPPSVLRMRTHAHSTRLSLQPAQNAAHQIRHFSHLLRSSLMGLSETWIPSFNVPIPN